jgi:hypothetical protein
MSDDDQDDTPENISAVAALNVLARCMDIFNAEADEAGKVSLTRKMPEDNAEIAFEMMAADHIIFVLVMELAKCRGVTPLQLLAEISATVEPINEGE